MLYISKVDKKNNRIGVVDTDDGVETIVSSEELVNTLKLLAIEGATLVKGKLNVRVYAPAVGAEPVGKGAGKNYMQLLGKYGDHCRVIGKVDTTLIVQQELSVFTIHAVSGRYLESIFREEDKTLVSTPFITLFAQEHLFISWYSLDAVHVEVHKWTGSCFIKLDVYNSDKKVHAKFHNCQWLGFGDDAGLLFLQYHEVGKPTKGYYSVYCYNARLGISCHAVKDADEVRSLIGGLAKRIESGSDDRQTYKVDAARTTNEPTGFKSVFTITSKKCKDSFNIEVVRNRKDTANPVKLAKVER